MKHNLILALIFSLLLSACGGGNDDNPNPESTRTPQSITSPTSTPTSAPTPTFSPTPTPTPVAQQPAIFEAEDGSLNGAAQVYLDDAASNGEGVGFLDQVGNGFSLSNVPASQSITVRYASQLRGEISVSVNSENAGNIIFDSSGSWVGTYLETIKNIDIPENATVTIFNEQGDFAMNVDFVEFHPEPQVEATPFPPPSLSSCAHSDPSIRFEAENTDIIGNSVEEISTVASASKMLLIPGGSENGLSVSTDHIANSITIGYLTETNQSISVLLNDQVIETLNLTTQTGVKKIGLNINIDADDVLSIRSLDGNQDVYIDYVEFNPEDTGKTFFDYVTDITNVDTAVDSITVASNGDIYLTGGINEGTEERLIKISASGQREVIALPGLLAPVNLEFNSQQDLIIADYSGDQVVIIDQDYNMSVLTESVDGAAGLAINSQDEVFVSSFDTNNLFKISTDGQIETLISDNGLNQPIGIAIDENDNVYIANWSNGNVYKYDTEANFSLLGTINGNINQMSYVDGYLYIPHGTQSQIFRMNVTDGQVEMFAGDLSTNVIDGHISEANFGAIGNITVSPDNQQLLLVAANGNLKKISVNPDPYQFTSTLANLNAVRDGSHVDGEGNLLVGGGNDYSVINSAGEVTNVSLNNAVQSVNGLDFDSDGNLYTASFFGSAIHKIDPEGNVTLFLGDLINVNDVLVDIDGNIFAALCGPDEIRQYSAEGDLLNTYDIAGDDNGCGVAGLTQNGQGAVFASNFSTGEIYKVENEQATLFTTVSGENNQVANVNHLAYSNGYVYAPAGALNQFYRIDEDGNSELFIGSPQSMQVTDNQVCEAEVINPWNVTVSNNGDALYIISSTGEVQIVTNYVLP